jgi:SagB-type dehydrogenase family enzyme
VEYRQAPFYRYHQETKHTVAKLRAQGGYLDWANQPDPFRRYRGAPEVRLPPPERPPPAEYFELADATGGPTVGLATVSQLLYYSMAIATWKELPGQDVRWALRVNPSAGNLHPVETHLVARGVDGLDDGCYHFNVERLALAARCTGPTDDLAAAFASHCSLPPTPLTVCLTSIVWRQAWKYRDRGFRYCYHDLGHALAAVVEAARGLGVPATYRHQFDDSVVADALGLGETDEVPGLLIAIGSPGDLPPETDPRSRTFVGQPNQLSDHTIEYESINEIHAATRVAAGPGDVPPRRLQFESDDVLTLPSEAASPADLWHVIRTRRSGVDFDGQTGAEVAQLGAILSRATRGASGDLFNSPGGGLPLVHLFVFVHRVSGVEPGLYHYDRERHALVRLHRGDVRYDAAALSLQQSIAADGAFAVAMIADLGGAYDAYGDRGYRAAHIEAGFIGQGLYLGAESVSLNGTGIGAFFDDEVNRYLNLPGGFEVIYHFTVGKAVDDPRLTNRPGYPFEAENGPT